MPEKPTNGRGVKLREDGQVQEGENRNEALMARVGEQATRNADLLRKAVGR